MGTTGYTVFRIKGRYYVYFTHDDYYTDGLQVGLHFLDEIPRSKEEFEEWVEHARCNPPELDDSDDSMDYMSDKQPEGNGFFDMEWTFEIDLDNLIFHVDNQPLFRLDNMPPDDIFLESISYDHFGHRAL